MSVRDIKLGTGLIYLAPEGTATPTTAVTAGVISDALAAAWKPIGLTEEGSVVKFKQDVTDLMAGEINFPLDGKTTNVEITVELAFAEVTTLNIQRALGGTITTTGTGATTLAKLVAPGSGVSPSRYAMIWQSSDNMERLLLPAVMSTDDVEIERRKDDQTYVGVTYKAYYPYAGGDMYTYWNSSQTASV